MSPPKCIASKHTAWLAVLLLVPWIALAITGGGVHSHLLRASTVALTPGSAALDVDSLSEAPRLQSDDVAARDAPCSACLWQLHSSASLPVSLAAAAALPAAPRIAACQTPLSAAGARSFDPRAPPLS